ncbi:hypothetical protein HCB37_04255 [Listeria booriae]|uniref:Uncharacterized protein n=1 Tax=Listeria booriae TaxID=1552123 RepID=A0A841XXZ8_9LIST|nr:hypothetical protein [Listeria booriae]MBC1231511.1 hypothetical protein [Listeria booriae]MBC1316621.1 hypothetical protein [Listeria booriae]MBC2263725.1 hypothetical protein [Listeria booriae]
MDMNDIIKKSIHSQEEVFGWLASLENYDKVTIDKPDGRKIEAIVRRDISAEEFMLGTTIRIKNSLFFTDVRVNGEDINVKH